MALKVLDENPSYVEDTDLGIVLPTRLAHVQYLPHAFEDPGKPRGDGFSWGLRHTPGVGTLLEHDNETGIAFWPPYASGLDDFLMRALVQGYMGNSGQTPVVDTLLSTIVAKIQGMVGTWVNTVSGKESPVRKTLDLMSRANDSPFGSAEFVREYMGALNVDNRGAIVAQVPIGNIVVDKWSEYGMELEEIQGQRVPGSNKQPELYILRMTQDAFRENQGLWMIDGLKCLPTGNKEYPYWIRKKVRDKKKNHIWVLIHRDFGFQILQQSGSRNELYSGFGQSGAWRYSPYEIKHMAIDRMDWEHLISQPMRGIFWVSGLDTPTQFRDQILQYRQELEDNDQLFYPGVFFGGSQGEGSKIAMHPWVEPPAGYTPKEWEDLKVSKLAAAFHLNETHLQLKLGEGAMTQSGVAQSLEAETAVAWMRHTIEMMWNYVSPPRVLITVVWPSDRARRFNTETWREGSLAISRLNKSPDPEDWVYTKAEIRALTTQYFGVDIPDTQEDDEVVTDRSGPEDIGEMMMPFTPASTLIEFGASRDVAFARGNKVKLKSGKKGVITGWSGNADWVWMRIDGWEMLVPAERFEVLEFAKGHTAPVVDEFSEVVSQLEDVLFTADPLVQPHKYQAGQRVCVGESNTPATVIKVTDKKAWVAFDWHPNPSQPHSYPLSELIPMGFEPEEGEPLDFPTDVETDQAEAETDARDLWGELSPEGKEDLI